MEHKTQLFHSHVTPKSHSGAFVSDLYFYIFSFSKPTLLLSEVVFSTQTSVSIHWKSLGYIVYVSELYGVSSYLNGFDTLRQGSQLIEAIVVNKYLYTRIYHHCSQESKDGCNPSVPWLMDGKTKCDRCQHPRYVHESFPLSLKSVFPWNQLFGL